MKLKLLLGPLLFKAITVSAQYTEISGYILTLKNVEGVHVINKTAQKFTITDKKGKFKIPVKLNDTISFSSIQYELKQVKITRDILEKAFINVELQDKLNTLDAVTIGKVLSGNLRDDIGKVEGKAPINFYNLGIPGYKGKKPTQSERRLAEAGEFKPKMLLGLLTGSVPLNPILNGISGRTKMLKARVQHEKQEVLIRKIRENLSEILFQIMPLEEEYRVDFFYFCEMDENFYEICNDAPDLQILEFLKQKLIAYKANQESKD